MKITKLPPPLVPAEPPFVELQLTRDEARRLHYLVDFYRATGENKSNGDLIFARELSYTLGELLK